MRSLLATSAVAYCLIAVLLLVMMRSGRGISRRLSAVMAVISLSFAGLVISWLIAGG